VISTSLCSIDTGTLNLCLTMPGLPGDTSVGLGTASSSTDRLWLLASRGMLPATSDPGSRLKYGIPYATKVITPPAANG
jgi:hypothetical protein